MPPSPTSRTVTIAPCGASRSWISSLWISMNPTRSFTSLRPRSASTIAKSSCGQSRSSPSLE
eukprot:1178655-Prorocentrum_minimum.AAC.1